MKLNKITSKIFAYENYRSFLKDYFSEQKKLKKMFSHRYFAKMAGFSSSSFCSHVMDGKKNLSINSILKMISGLELEGKAARYFETLVLYNQAKTLHERELFFTQLNKIRKSTRFYRVNKKQFVFYDKWYYSVIRELVVYSNWNGDYEKLGKMVVPPISREKAKKSVEILLEIGLLKKDNKGTYRQSSKVITGESAPPVAINKLKKEFLFKAVDSEEKFKKPHKYSSSVTLSMSMKNYNKAKKMIDELRRQILIMAMDDSKVDKVFQANFQMFPLTKLLKNPKEAKNDEDA
jgi:uncharacterized protein (TIGR02147 family)